jgi:hypothetical protein
MTKPIPDKAEVALEFPDKVYIGTFERTSRFSTHFDERGVSLHLQGAGDAETHKSVRMHFHYALFAEILRELAKTVSSVPLHSGVNKDTLRDSAKALYLALALDAEVADSKDDDIFKTSEEEMLLLHIME